MLLEWSVTEALTRNWAIVAIVMTVAMLVVVPALVVLKYVRISLNIMRSTKPPLSRGPLDFVRLTGQPVSFTAFDGLRLSGMLVRANPDTPRKGMIIYAHEFCSDMHSCARYCRPLQQAGYDIFTFDFRGHGQSDREPGHDPRQWLTDREQNDMRGAVATVEEWLEQNGFPVEIGVFGTSRGAGAAILAASENPRIRAVVADGAFSTDRTIEHLMKRWAYIFAKVRVVYENHHPYFWRFLRWTMICFARREFRCNFPSLYKTIQRMKPRPMLFIHGEKDSYLPVEQSRLLYALAAQPKSIWIAPEARHNQAVVVHPETYARITINFFDKHLAPRLTRKASPIETTRPAPASTPVAQSAP